LPVNPYVFYLDGGIQAETDALINFALQHFPRKDLKLAIASCDEEISAEAAALIRTRLAGSGRLAMPPADLVFWLRRDVNSLPTVAVPGRSVILIPGSLLDARQNLVPFRKAQVFIAFGPGTRQESALDADAPVRVAWDRATASAALLTEAMKVAGRELTRAGFLAALEGLRGFETTFSSPISFGPNRRVGASGVNIMTLDPKNGKLTRLEMAAVKNSPASLPKL
jgi:hypothetical protein